MLTKIVVVVDEKHKEIFEGNVEARTNNGMEIGGLEPTNVLTEPVLFIDDLDKNDQIAAFIKYEYWRYTK